LQIYYVYLILNPLKNNEPFYVGKGKRYRHKEHFSRQRDLIKNNHKNNTIRKISAAHKGKSTLKLLNGVLVPPNTGSKLSEEAKEKIRNHNLGKKQFLETIQKRINTRKMNKYNENLKKKE
jgi:hypothetical protein